ATVRVACDATLTYLPRSALRFSNSNRSPLQQIDRLPNIRHPYVARQRWMLPLDRPVHLPGHAAIREVPLRRRSQLADVQGLGKIHLEERAAARAERQQIA